MNCPKCGFEQEEGTECGKCGVIFAKYRPRPAKDLTPRECPAAGDQSTSKPSEGVPQAPSPSVPPGAPPQPVPENKAGAPFYLWGILFLSVLVFTWRYRPVDESCPRKAPPPVPATSETEKARDKASKTASTEESDSPFSGLTPLTSKVASHKAKAGGHPEQKGAGESSESKSNDADQTAPLDPKDPEAYFARGLDRFKQGELDQAIEDFSETLLLKRDHLEALDYLAFCQLQKGNYDEALAHLNRLVNLKPNHENGRAYSMLGAVYFHKNDKNKARENARIACDLGSRDGCTALARLGR